MATKKRRKKKQPNLHSRIVGHIVERGPMRLRDMTRILGARYQSINTEVLELRRLGVLQKDADGVWSLVPGADLEVFGIRPTDTPVSPAEEYSRTIEEKFLDLLRSVGVKKAAETITDLFSSGEDIWDMQWLHHVLTWSAEGFVTEDQAKLIMAYWAHTNGIPYRHEDFFSD
ncbi:MAG: hypothetical protein V3S51_08975 [Dehalococcoidia bacterium]